jgi:dTDP-4-dehydrorhamnose 3,5-epimerase
VKFIALPLAGAFVVEPEPVVDERGFFARTFCSREFAAQGLESQFLQCSVSSSKLAGTLRGLHYQKAPHEEAKLVRCTTGAIHDVIVDLRRESASFRRWAAVELSATNRKALYIPRGLAHGFLTLTDDTEVLYQMSEEFNAESAAGVRWDDPAFGIEWPGQVRAISDRDRAYPDFPR